MEIRQYIAIKNTEGVKTWASQNGYPVPSDTQQAYDLLTRLYRENPVQAQVIFKELHPDKFLFGTQATVTPGTEGGRQIIYMNKSTKSDFFSACGCEMHNATGDCGCGCGGKCQGSNSMRNASGGLMQYAEQGVGDAKNLFIDLTKEIKESAKERDDRIFKYGAVLVLGFLAGKYIFK